MSGERLIHVANDCLPFFEGWLEFAGRDVPGVAFCPDWPADFTISRLVLVDTEPYCRGLHQRIDNCTTFLVKSPEFDGSRCWSPTIYSPTRPVMAG